MNIAENIYELRLENIIPENILANENIKALTHALNPEGLSISRNISEVIILSRIDELNEKVLDLLAALYHVDFYDLAATLNMKREAVKGSLIWHMHKGTEWAIKKALSMIGIESEFLHWKDTGDEPYTFRIRAKITGDYYRTQGRDKIIASIRRAVMESKSARSYFAGLDTRIEFKDENNIYAGLFDALTGFYILGLAKINPPGENNIYAGLADALEGHRKILISHDKNKHGKIYAGIVSVKDIAHEIGVDERTMQELLLRFEERIFSRLDDFEARVTDQINNHESKINIQLEEIKDMLRWKGPDEEL
ncbi:MAG: phage tail protein [Synergistaceae bacterium]|nr:phage tail protein [Synergistaceae bacterium]